MELKLLWFFFGKFNFYMGEWYRKGQIVIIKLFKTIFLGEWVVLGTYNKKNKFIDNIRVSIIYKYFSMVSLC